MRGAKKTKTRTANLILIVDQRPKDSVPKTAVVLIQTTVLGLVDLKQITLVVQILPGLFLVTNIIQNVSNLFI